LQLEARVVQQAGSARKPSPLAGEGLDEGLEPWSPGKLCPEHPSTVVGPPAGGGRVETIPGTAGSRYARLTPRYSTTVIQIENAKSRVLL